jgi:PRTRC genetic system protein A
VKNDPQQNFPQKERMFYLLAANGLFVCRNHQFFRSCVPAGSGPGELANQEAFLDFQYPKIPKRLLELTVGFFAKAGRRYNAEAIVMLVWDDRKKKVYLLVPRQRSSVYQGYYGTWPVGVEYDVPLNLPADHFVFGDIHSHVGMAAYSSQIDKHDEKNRPGLHVVVGRIQAEPPEFHIEIIADGMRFKVEQDLVLEGYHRRAKVSNKYLKQVNIENVNAVRGYWINDGNGKSIYVPFRDHYPEAVSAQDDEIVTIE